MATVTRLAERQIKLATVARSAREELRDTSLTRRWGIAFRIAVRRLLFRRIGRLGV
jgi:hypothetical protein